MTSLAGSFLVARSALKDPNFHQTVVLLLQHGPEGAFGVVVNRPTTVQDLPFTVYTGGPCQFEGLLMLHGQADWVADEAGTQVAPGIFLGTAESVARVSERLEEEGLRFRMFAGYSGWGPDQLERELVVGAWQVHQANGELLFDTPVDELWDRLMPPSIPQPSLN